MTTDREKLENFLRSATKDMNRFVKATFTMTHKRGEAPYTVSAILTSASGKKAEVSATFETRVQANYCMSRHEHSAENSFGFSLVSREEGEGQSPDFRKEWMIETSTWS